MKSLLAPLIAVAVCAVFLAVLFWSPWDARERERELEWVEAFAAWFEDVEARLPLAGTACRASFDREVGSAPTGRLQTAATVARAGCRHARNEHGWQTARWNVLRGLVDGHSSRARATFEPGLSRIARFDRGAKGPNTLLARI